MREDAILLAKTLARRPPDLRGEVALCGKTGAGM
jgi:hypothetical protein